ncbi:MAG: STAS domain-containing protein [Bacillota bacterium]
MEESRIAWQGSLDMASVKRFVSQVQSAGDAPVLVLDLSEMDFVDSTGIRSLIGVKQRMVEEGRVLQVEGLRPDVLDILDIMGIRDLLFDAG